MYHENKQKRKESRGTRDNIVLKCSQENFINMSRWKSNISTADTEMGHEATWFYCLPKHLPWLTGYAARELSTERMVLWGTGLWYNTGRWGGGHKNRKINDGYLGCPSFVIKCFFSWAFQLFISLSTLGNLQHCSSSWNSAIIPISILLRRKRPKEDICPSQEQRQN